MDAKVLCHKLGINLDGEQTPQTPQKTRELYYTRVSVSEYNAHVSLSSISCMYRVTAASTRIFILYFT